MNHIKPLVLALTAISLAACSGGKKENPKLDYQSANNKIVSLEVPPDLNDPRNGDLYSLPKGTTANPNALKETKSQGGTKVLNQVKDAHIKACVNCLTKWAWAACIPPANGINS